MSRVTATEAARNFSELMNRVKYQGQTFDVVRGNETIARIVPVGSTSSMLASSLNDFFAMLPKLSMDELALFEADLARIRAEAVAVESKEWD